MEKMEPNQRQKKQTKKAKPNNNPVKKHWKWLIFIFVFSFSVALTFGILAQTMNGANKIAVCIAIIVALILIAFLGDIFAVAGAYADIAVFNSMASRKIKGAKTAIYLVKHSDRVSSILSDILGDCCGIVSGAVGVSLSLIILSHAVLTVFMQGVVIALVNASIAATAIMAKSIAKKIAIANSTKIVLFFGRFLAKFGVK